MTATLPRATHESDFAPLLARVRAAGLLRRRRGRYAGLAAGDAALFLVSVVGLVLVGESWWAVVFAAPLALWSARMGFLGHDAGHRQIAAKKTWNRRIGFVTGNLFLGMSQGWWERKHTRHHANPNDLDKDPDVMSSVVAFHVDGVAGRTGFTRWFARHQGTLFIPLITLEAIQLQVASTLDVVRRRRWAEGSIMLAHHVIYLGLVFVALPFWTALAFVAVHQAVLGVHLGLAFAPNHKGMPMPQPGEKWTHLQRQVLTSRNVTGGVVVDWLLGGLNHQVEHHLFPSVPRMSLPKLRPLVREHCASLDMPYTETTLLRSYAIAFGYLNHVGVTGTSAPVTG